MSSADLPKLEPLRQACQRCDQGHLFTFWDRLDADDRERLLRDVSQIPFDEMPALLRLVRAADSHSTYRAIEPPACVRRPSDWHRDPRTRRGEELLRASSVAAFLVAGGQGTRLGFDGPKGAFPVSPVRNKTLFQLFAEQVQATNRRYAARIPWYIMTSEANDAATRAFFSRHAYFGVEPEDVTFFMQGAMPAFSFDGKILLDQPGRVALSPDGHGGSLLAMARSGVLSDMRRRGVEHISYFQVDNPLVRCLDPFFVGLHAEAGSEMSSKMVPKASDDEKVGVFAVCDGVLRVLEYSDLPRELSTAKTSDGARKFDAGSIAIHVLSRTFVERLTADPASFALPWHRAVKKVPHVDLATGARVEPREPNAVKLEAFVFDALPLAKNPVVLQTDRAAEFSPVKNATGADSVDTAQRDMSRRAARWLERAGANIPRRSDGDYEGTFEISPLRALDEMDLSVGRVPLPEVGMGSRVYVE